MENNYGRDRLIIVVYASIRADGSSRFPKGNKYAIFPSVSASWRIISEAFFYVLLHAPPSGKSCLLYTSRCV